MNFTALDFETANHLKTSACSIGLVKVRNSVVVDKFYSLINPLSEFAYGNISVHGIKPYMVDDAPTFKELWPQIEAFIGDDILIAHNASFDQSVLNHCLEWSEIDYQPTQFICSVKVARKAWPNLESYRLNQLANYLNISLIHHHALEDAFAAAQILICADQIENVDYPKELAKQITNIKK